ncbi:cyclophilin-like fold protein [Dactylosporangium sp. NPDC049140]|uniref:cyclophilin-like fold protein n=1 Tax=Dactylosporangium sp. NPDC049140 TaxID=3155647 RepID=UPI0033ECDA84
MTTTVRPRRSRRAAAWLAAALLTVAAGCSTPARPATPPPDAAAGIAVLLHVGGRTAPAVLADTPPARQLAAMLPVTVDLRDVWGQAKAGPLPGALTAEGTVPVHDPAPGGIYFWAETDVIAIYYDDLGQAVPDPGLIRLGTVGPGLDAIAEAGRHLTVRIERAPEARP